MLKIISMLLFFVFSSCLFADQIKEVGKIEFDKKTGTYLFYFIKDNKIQSVVIRPKNKNEANLLKLNIGKSVVLEGEVKPIISNKEGILFQEEVDSKKIQALNEELLKIDTKKMLGQYNLLSHEKKPNVITATPSFGISNQAAHSVIVVAGSVVGIAAGPITLVPIAVYLIQEGATK